MAVCTCYSSFEGQIQVDPSNSQSSQLASLAKAAIFQFTEIPCLERNKAESSRSRHPCASYGLHLCVLGLNTCTLECSLQQNHKNVKLLCEERQMLRELYNVPANGNQQCFCLNCQLSVYSLHLSTTCSICGNL